MPAWINDLLHHCTAINSLQAQIALVRVTPEVEGCTWSRGGSTRDGRLLFDTSFRLYGEQQPCKRRDQVPQWVLCPVHVRYTMHLSSSDPVASTHQACMAYHRSVIILKHAVGLWRKHGHVLTQLGVASGADPVPQTQSWTASTLVWLMTTLQPLWLFQRGTSGDTYT